MEPVHDRIKKLGEYILVKDKKQYSILDMSGNSVNENKYKKVRLDRNTLQGRTSDDNWVNVSTGLEYKKE